jgi:hypothetical protein
MSITRDVEAIACELFGLKGWTSISSCLLWNEGHAWAITHRGEIIATICEDAEGNKDWWR